MTQHSPNAGGSSPSSEPGYLPTRSIWRFTRPLNFFRFSPIRRLGSRNVVVGHWAVLVTDYDNKTFKLKSGPSVNNGTHELISEPNCSTHRIMEISVYTSTTVSKFRRKRSLFATQGKPGTTTDNIEAIGTSHTQSA